MKTSPNRSSFLSNNLILLAAISLAIFVLHIFTNGQYGWHRDELAALDDARHLDWGFVAYPPVMPFIGRVGLALFGPSLVGVRLFAALAQSMAIFLTGLMARELGGGRLAQVSAALMTAITPYSLAIGSMFMYVSFDYLWWVLIAYLVIRLLKSQDPRWWPGIGAAIGLGMMTKFTILFYVAGLAGGVLLTPARRWLRSPWLWGGVGLSLLIFLPNMLWQVQHDFITLEFLGSIHERDVDIGRTSGFILDQFIQCASGFTVLWWLGGLRYYMLEPDGKPYRLLGWMYLIPLALFIAAQGRGYYLAPAYPMLFAAGAMRWEAGLTSLSPSARRRSASIGWPALAAGGITSALLMLPLTPVNSPVWRTANQVHDLFREQLGWPELTETVANIYHALPAEQRSQTGILAGNYGEAGAVNLYGPAYGLPQAISGINSYWLRGYGDPPPQTLIVIGFNYSTADRLFTNCKLAGHITNRHDVLNEETEDHPDIWLCGHPRLPWEKLWPNFRWFG